jgi:hypothetical protein
VPSEPLTPHRVEQIAKAPGRLPKTPRLDPGRNFGNTVLVPDKRGLSCTSGTAAAARRCSTRWGSSPRRAKIYSKVAGVPE